MPVTAVKDFNSNLIQKISKSISKLTKTQFLALTISMVVIFSLSAYQLLNSNTNEYDQSLPMPSTMPSMDDSSLMSAESIDSAYAFAKGHPEILQYVDCFCGCYSPPLNHKNNYDCFWNSKGELDQHASNCFTCVHIALTAQSLFEAGWSVTSINNYINSIY